MLSKGFKFGMLLQLSIGPMCLMVFNTAANTDMAYALVLVLAIALTDALYIFLAVIGISKILRYKNIQIFIKLIGSSILMLFGLNIILNVFDTKILIFENAFSNISVSNIFLKGIILTLSNPLTIIFWAGVFSSKAVNDNLEKNQLYQFGLGCILSTLIFLSVVAFIGGFFKAFIPDLIINILNVCVGGFIFGCGIKFLITKIKNME